MSYEFALVLGIMNVLIGVFCIFQSTRLTMFMIELGDSRIGIALSVLAGAIGVVVMAVGAWLLTQL